MSDKNCAKDRESRQTGQKSRPGLKPSLVPEHDSILLYRFEEDIGQAYRHDLDGNSVQVACAFDHGFGILAGEYAHLSFSCSDFLDTGDAKFPLGRGAPEGKINSRTGF